jgi:arylsulfatase A-like enzyme
VVFISIDDQNDWLGFLRNHPGTRTPELDAFAAGALSFTNAYVTAPMCLPSRTSVLFGRAPHTTGVYDHSETSRLAYRSFAEQTTCLTDDFWVAGYNVYGAGKVFNMAHEERWTASLTTPYWAGATARNDPATLPTQFDPEWISPYTGDRIGTGDGFQSGDIDFGPSGVPLEDEPDMISTAWVLDRLRETHDQRPFFLGLGLLATHEPWRLPQQFLDMHPLDEIVVPEYVGPDEDDLADLGPYARDRIIDQFGAFERLMETDAWPQLVQAYQAATSFADHCAGLVLDQLADSPYADNTIVVVWSDNGFHLGEKQHLHKFTLWEPSTRIPLVVRAPGRLEGGTTFDPPVSLLDLGPTVAGLAGVTVLDEDHQGQSLLPLLDDPAAADDRPPVMTWLEGNHSVRRGDWRLIRYTTGETELYDIAGDPGELTNLAGQAEHAALESELAAFLPTSG